MDLLLVGFVLGGVLVHFLIKSHRP